MDGIGETPDAQVPDAFEVFYREEYRSMVALAYGLTVDRRIAEEVAQEAFIRVLRDWKRVQAMESPGGWVRTVTLNLARSRWRRVRSELRALVRLDAMRAPGSASPSETSSDFWVHVRRLPTRQAQVIALRYIEDRSIGEIASLLRIAEGTVKASLHQGRQALARALRDEGWVEDVV